ncbi:hypothetical protein HF526_15095 [Pseudonocardia sp. K10HN5]|uniref:Uncharacterized protein n=1 Tax=Pseudonocardia acidicola TaxID=2724939 RepID=A0ABX1SEJ9_9PSEU|nr:hypothetical protein [Pseudonocardia acidicola]NMH98623.1 hypothetical protein [Pseudonocardia acidicola]
MKWRKRTWERHLDSLLLPTIPEIGRSQATAAAAHAADGDDQAVRAFVTAMIWGYGPVGYGAWRTRRILDLSGAVAGHRLREVALAAADGPIEAFSAMARAPLPYLGPAFGTKYIYFCTAAVRDRHGGRTAPVLDEVVRRWFARHTGSRLSGTWSVPQYRWYLSCLESWGSTLGIPSDHVEELIFRSRVTTEENRLWAERLLVGTDSQGEALAALDDLRAAIDVLGDSAAEASDPLLEQLRTVIGTDPDEELPDREPS